MSVNFSVYDKDDFKFVIFGNERNAKIVDLLAAGHIRGPDGENGGPPNYLMWDTRQGRAVPDTDRRTEYEEQKERPTERLDLAIEAYDTFTALVDTDPTWDQANLSSAMIYLKDMMAYHFEDASNSNRNP